jgi:hypothetical protein
MAITDQSQPSIVIRPAQPEDDILYGDEILRIINTAYRSSNVFLMLEFTLFSPVLNK